MSNRSRARITLAVAVLLTGVYAGPSAAQQEKPPVVEIDESRALFAIGAQLQRQLAMLALSDDELERLLEGLRSTRDGSTKLDMRKEMQNMQAFQRARLTAALEAERTAAKAFAEKAAAEQGAKTFPSGLIYRELESGDGPKPEAISKVRVHYHGMLRDGSVFDSSVDRGEPAEFSLQGVIKCWTEGVQMMKVGTKAKLTCPAEIAYGDRGFQSSIPGGAALSFEVELLEIVK